MKKKLFDDIMESIHSFDGLSRDCAYMLTKKYNRLGFLKFFFQSTVLYVLSIILFCDVFQRLYNFISSLFFD